MGLLNVQTHLVFDPRYLQATGQTTVGTNTDVSYPAGSGAGASVTVSVTFSSRLPGFYSAHATPSTPAIVSIGNKTATGFTVTLTPATASATIAAGTLDISVTA